METPSFSWQMPWKFHDLNLPKIHVMFLSKKYLFCVFYFCSVTLGSHQDPEFPGHPNTEDCEKCLSFVGRERRETFVLQVLHKFGYFGRLAKVR